MPSNLFPHAFTKIREPTARTNSESNNNSDEPPKTLQKGVVLDKDGKPCRTCTSSAAWMALMKSSNSPSEFSSSTSNPSPSSISATPSSLSQEEPDDCPPDVDALGRSTWTLLHSLTATYSPNPSPTTQTKTLKFLQLFSEMYPCWVCADDFRSWMSTSGNEPKLGNQEDFGQWMCRAHNAVNVKLGKEEFNCARWKERWQDGWKDGRCG